MCLGQLGPPHPGLLAELQAVRLQGDGVDGLLVASRCLSLLRLLEWKLAEPTCEAGRTQAVFPRAADASIHTSQGTHHCRETDRGHERGRRAETNTGQKFRAMNHIRREENLSNTKQELNLKNIRPPSLFTRPLLLKQHHTEAVLIF